MNYSEKLKTDYPDLISRTTHMFPENYDEINFEKFLGRILPNSNAFISSDIVVEIRDILTQKYGNYSYCIKDNGTLRYIAFEELEYYQPTVGINGPKHSQIDEPVYAIEYKNKTILFNGYHRALIHLLNKHKTINAYILAI